MHSAILGVIASSGPVSADLTIELPASAFVRGEDVAMASGTALVYGADALMNAPPYTSRPNAAEWDFSLVIEGSYTLFATYAAGASRPCSVLFNGDLTFPDALATVTGGFYAEDRQTEEQGVVFLPAGANIMRVERAAEIPHIAGFTLVRVVV